MILLNLAPVLCFLGRSAPGLRVGPRTVLLIGLHCFFPQADLCVLIHFRIQSGLLNRSATPQLVGRFHEGEKTTLVVVKRSVH